MFLVLKIEGFENKFVGYIQWKSEQYNTVLTNNII